MNAATLRRLGFVLAGLVVIWLGLSALGRVRRDTVRPMALAHFDPAVVDEALIVKGSDTVRFARTAGGWTVNGFRADAGAVSELVRALGDTSARSELVAENAASHKALGLDSADAHLVSVLRGGHAVAQLLVGHQGSTYGTAMVRKPGQTAVYQLTSELAEMVGRPLDAWRDKVIARLSPESVTAVEVQRGRMRYALTKSGGAWRLGNAAADSAAVAQLLDRFRDLTATAFATKAQADSASRARSLRTIRIYGAGGRPVLALSLDSAASGAWTRREGDSVTYVLDNWTANQLMPVDSTLRAKAAKKPK